MKSIRAAPIIFLMAIGCTTTRSDSVKTGLFGDSIENLSKAYQSIDQCGANPTKEDIINAGFRFDAPNIERVPGPAAFRRIFGDNFFQGAGSDPKRMEEALKEANKYYAIFIPFRDITTETDRFYFTKKETHRSGDDLVILFVFKKPEGADNRKEVLYYRDYQYVKIDSHESESAFAQGLLELIDKYGKFGSNMKDLVERLKDLLNKNKDED